MKDGLVDRAEVLRIIQEARESGETDLRSIRALVEYLPAATPSATPSAAAMRAAKDVVNEILNVPRFVRNPEDTIIEIEEKVAAIITRHFAAPAFVLSRIAALAHEGRNITHAGTHSLLAEIEEIAAAATTSPETPAPVQAAGDDENERAKEVVREWVAGLEYGTLPPGKITDLTNRIAAALRSGAGNDEGT